MVDSRTTTTGGDMHPRTMIGRVLENLDLLLPIGIGIVGIALGSFILWGIFAW